MHVRVILHSYLREKLPAEKRGQAEIELPEGSTVADLFRLLDLPERAAWGKNGTLERDLNTALAEGDEVRVFRQGAGG
jgi:sulfur carrier protein ThiS